MKISLVTAAAALLVLTGCNTTGYKSVENTAKLSLSFTDSAWDGKVVPKGQQCQRFEGDNPKTPGIRVSGIPSKANALVVEYSDRSYPAMDNGGHGKIGYQIKPGTVSAEIPSVPGHTFDLPTDFFLVTAHQAPGWDKAGAYMPPCSGGGGNSYYATIKAIHRNESKKEESLLLGEGVIQLGRY